MSHNLSRKFDRPLRVELGASGLLLSWALALYLGAALLCLWAPLPGVLLLALGAHFAYLYCLHVRRCLPFAVRAVSWDAARGWRLRQARGDWLAVTPLVPLFVSYRLVAVRFRCGRCSRRSLLVAAHSCPADDFRRLRVRLIQSAHGHRDRTQVSGV